MKYYFLGVVSCALVFIGCGATFSYRYYGLVEADFTKGRLLGPDPKDDLPFEVCAPTPGDVSPCTIIKTKDFLNLKRDYKDLQNKLKRCEQGS